MALGILCISLLIVSLDDTILNIALPALVRDLRATESQLQWIVDVYACVFAGLLLIAGSVEGRFGRKRLLLAGADHLRVRVPAGSAFSDSVTTLISARAIMGVGAACIMPATLSIITDVFREPSEQARANWGLVGDHRSWYRHWPDSGRVVAPPIFWWGSVFLINVPVAGVGALGALLWIPETHDSYF